SGAEVRAAMGEGAGYTPGGGNGRRFVPIGLSESEPEIPLDPDVEKHKRPAMLGYIFFLTPLVAAPNSRFARFHANQGLLLQLTWIVAFITIGVLWALSTLAARLLADINIL